MLSEKMQQALNDQINAETFSAYLYKAMQAYFDSISLKGFAQWMSVQVQEETFHADKFFNFIQERNGRVKLMKIEEPQFEWDSPLAAFEAALKHEQYITSRINNLVAVARAENDPASESFLKWFVDEQVEEEANATEIVDHLKLMGDFKGGLFMMDRELGQRVFVPPVSGGAA